MTSQIIKSVFVYKLADDDGLKSSISNNVKNNFQVAQTTSSTNGSIQTACTLTPMGLKETSWAQRNQAEGFLIPSLQRTATVKFLMISQKECF